MPYLRNLQTGVVVGPMADDSRLYRQLQAQRGVNNKPVWEDVPVEVAEAAAPAAVFSGSVDGGSALTVDLGV